MSKRQYFCFLLLFHLYVVFFVHKHFFFQGPDLQGPKPVVGFFFSFYCLSVNFFVLIFMCL